MSIRQGAKLHSSCNGPKKEKPNTYPTLIGTSSHIGEPKESYFKWNHKPREIKSVCFIDNDGKVAAARVIPFSVHARVRSRPWQSGAVRVPGSKPPPSTKIEAPSNESSSSRLFKVKPRVGGSSRSTIEGKNSTLVGLGGHGHGHDLVDRSLCKTNSEGKAMYLDLLDDHGHRHDSAGQSSNEGNPISLDALDDGFPTLHSMDQPSSTTNKVEFSDSAGQSSTITNEFSDSTDQSSTITNEGKPIPLDALDEGFPTTHSMGQPSSTTNEVEFSDSASQSSTITNECKTIPLDALDDGFPTLHSMGQPSSTTNEVEFSSSNSTGHKPPTSSITVMIQLPGLSEPKSEDLSTQSQDGNRPAGMVWMKYKYLNTLREQEAEANRLRMRKQEAKKQAQEWMLDYCMGEEIQRLAPHGASRVKALVEAFETVMRYGNSKGTPRHGSEHCFAA